MVTPNTEPKGFIESLHLLKMETIHRHEEEEEEEKRALVLTNLSHYCIVLYSLFIFRFLLIIGQLVLIDYVLLVLLYQFLYFIFITKVSIKISEAVDEIFL